MANFTIVWEQNHEVGEHSENDVYTGDEGVKALFHLNLRVLQSFHLTTLQAPYNNICPVKVKVNTNTD